MLTLVRLDLEAHPPGAAVVGLAVTAHPVRVVAGQGGLWQPTMPAIRELATVLTRLVALVGPASVGAPQLVDSHRPDAVTLVRFDPGVRDARVVWPETTEREARGSAGPRRGGVSPRSGAEGPHWGMGGASTAGDAPPRLGPADPRALTSDTLALRRLRPPRAIEVEWSDDAPFAVRWNGARYRVMTSAGPWRLSGDWWDVDGWARDEWDVALSDGTLCRIVLDLRTGQWFLDGVYD